ncbi:uncharacterized protein ACLA_046840 [Aspergillus clavatus NRRL 1]|uniref:Uncharacterized protein n=1 Tax=Aspergillus clavatus (strain ATCC 1007 / CBS 513.65 / DSM 816 / NCTC 3887 / NRRL 1 / QM 1276 / 107) TaxID=344612 RepID=A1CH63_ASPCL|nr:uncharacterized protein ACLA_046840 [Aspergillus clavatus NRRL 1]EAW10218.1 conserved hypothetical protein [Aspergillus clavatus NRRL 1]
MQLEVLGNRNTRDNNSSSPRNGGEIDRQNPDGESADRRTVAEFLDSLLSSQGHDIVSTSSEAMDSDGLSNMTTVVSPVAEDNVLSPASQHQGHDQHPPTGDQLHGAHVAQPASSLANILPDSVEEPSQDENLEPASEAEAMFVHDGDDDDDPGVPPLLDSHPPRESAVKATSSPHRVTILSCHPVDSLASHIASVVTTALFIPLESLYLRSLASSYLSSIGSPALLPDVRPLGAWGGGGSVSDIVVYMGKVTLMLGLQAAVNASVWGVISGAAIKIGKRFCGWGSL